MSKTHIEWADMTINPVAGCSKLSAGCRNCYAERRAWRLKCMGIEKYQDVVNKAGWTGEIRSDMSVFDRLPKKTHQRIFVGSMGDLFHEKVLYGDIRNIWYQFKKNPMHTFMVLTKRPHIMKDILDSIYSKERLGAAMGFWAHVWLGVTAENQSQANYRLPVLLEIPARVRFVSCEPMLESIDLRKHLTDHQIKWVICGAETGPGKRQMELTWAADLQDQCKASRTPFFFKKDSTGQWPGGFRRDFPYTGDF